MKLMFYGSLLASFLGSLSSLVSAETSNSRNETKAKIKIFEDHEVNTTDGYLLSLYRILPSQGTPKRGQILLLHGLALTAKMFIQLKDDSLAHILSQNGYDVWLLNSRSEAHEFFNKKSKKFWDFSFHEIGIFDLPATVDYILKKTQEKSLNFVGFSQGGAAGLVMLSMKPEYNKKIRQMHLMAPAVFMAENLTSIFYLNLKLMNAQYKRGRYVIDTKRLISGFCQLEGSECPNVINSFLGQSKMVADQTSATVKSMAERSGSKQFAHLQQLKESKRFQMFDYKEKNLEIYGKDQPDEYNLRKVVTPTYVYQGDSDSIIPVTGTKKLVDLLPNIKKMYIFEDCNHYDFFADRNAKTTVYSKILKSLNQ